MVLTPSVISTDVITPKLDDYIASTILKTSHFYATTAIRSSHSALQVP